MTRDDAQILACGLFPAGQDIEMLSPDGRRELKQAIDRVLVMMQPRRYSIEHVRILANQLGYDLVRRS